MPKGIPKKGFRLPRKQRVESLEEIERQLSRKVPAIIQELEKLTKPIPCPHCGNEVRFIDKDVGMYLIDRVMGKPKQRTEVDITQTILLNADQIDQVLKNHLPQIVEIYKPEIAALLGTSQMDSSAKYDIVEGGVIEANHD